MIELVLFGGASLSGEQGPIQGRSAQRRRLALLAVLAVSNRPISRDKLIALLWPEHDADGARRLLSESLYVIRKATGEDAFLSTSDELQLNTKVIQSDVAEFTAALERSDYESVARLYTGPFLDGFFISDAPEFEQWVDVHRERFARAYVQSLEALANAATEAGDARGAVKWWRRLAASDVYSARIALGLMRALEASGDRAGALQHARIHAALLGKEYEAEPDPDVEAYAARLRGEPTTITAAETPADPPPPAAPRDVVSDTARSDQAVPDGRRLAAIVFTDIVGYTAMMQTDEATALAARVRHREAVRQGASLHDGEIVQFLGDASLTIYASAVEAVRAAIDMQRIISEAPPVPLRIGVHQGEIARDEQGIYGDAVNIAARLQNLSPEGGILVSAKIRDEIRNQKSLPVVPCGKVTLRNVAEPVSIYAIATPGLNVGKPGEYAHVDGGPETVPFLQRLVGHGSTESAPNFPGAGPPRSDRPSSNILSRQRSKGVTLMIGAAVLVAAISIGVIAMRRLTREAVVPIAGTNEIWAIFPCNTQTTPEFAHLKDALVLLLTPALDGVAGVHAVDHHALYARLARRRNDTDPGPAEAAQIAGRFNATAFLLCSIFESGGTIRIDARMYEPDARLRYETYATGTNILPLVEGIGIELLAQSVERQGQSGIELELPTGQLDAFLWYVEGEKQFLAANYASASAAFERAVLADPEFALAHYRASMAYEWNFEFQKARPAIRLAIANADRLSSKGHQLARAWAASLDGRYNEAERDYDQILNRFPDDIEARASRAEVLMHFNPVRHRSSFAAQSDLDRVLAELPAYGEVRFHRMELAAMAGDSATFHDLLAAVDTTGDQYLAWEAVRAFGWASAEEQRRIVDRLRHAEPITVFVAIGRVGAHLHDFVNASTLTDLLIQPAQTASWNAAGHLLRAEAAIATGRFTEAQAEFALAATVEPSWSKELKSLALLHPLVLPDSAVLAAWRDTLAAWNPGEQNTSDALVFAPHADSHGMLRSYLLGLFSARLGDERAANRAGQDAAMSSLPSREFASGLSSSIRARIFLERGTPADTTQALGLLRAEIVSPLERIIASPFFSRAHDRFLTGELLMARGELARADSVFSALLEGFDGMYVAPAHLRRAEIHETLADSAEAMRHYARFAELWSSADPQFQPLLERAHARIEALRAN